MHSQLPARQAILIDPRREQAKRADGKTEAKTTLDIRGQRDTFAANL
jgi:hypothetical protein